MTQKRRDRTAAARQARYRQRQKERVAALEAALAAARADRANRRNATPGWIISELNRLAAQASWLSPSWQDPERFHIAKSELVGSIRRLARNIDHQQLVGLRAVAGREVERRRG